MATTEAAHAGALSNISLSASGNVALSNAKKAKQDEFYTQLCDIENELKHYKSQLNTLLQWCVSLKRANGGCSNEAGFTSSAHGFG